MTVVSPPAEYVARIVVGTTSILRTLSDMLRELVREVNFTFAPTGLRIATLDVSKSVLVHCTLPAGDFQSFECSRRFSAGVVVNVLHRLLKASSASDTLTMTVDTDRRFLYLQLANSQRHTSTCYSITLLDAGAIDVKMLDFSYKFVVRQSCQSLHTLLKNMSGVSTTVSIESDGQCMAFTAAGEFLQQTTIVSEKGQVERLGEPRVYTGRFRIKPLLVASRCSALCMSCDVYMSPGVPLMFSFAAGPHGVIQTAFMTLE
jgi:proliferating cell nuclear antigen PCNA